ncbi:glycosyltransferase family 4 protein [Dermatophilaceae bacterium Sec6.4]
MNRYSNPFPAGLALIANNGDIGGGEVMLLEMARLARGADVDVRVIAPKYPPEIVDAARAEGFIVLQFEGITRLQQARSLRRLLRGSSDVLWCNGLAPALATTGRRRRVAHIHQLPTWKHVATARVAAIRARCTLVPSQAMADLLPTSRVMLNWTSPLEVTARPDSQGSPMILGYLGRITCAKGVDVLLQALKILEDRKAGRFILRMAGDARFAPSADSVAIDAALLPVVHLVEQLGWVDRADFFCSIDLAVFPSTVREPFGLVAAEAMSARVAFVVSDSGGLPEVAGPDHPFVARAGDPESLADAIEAASSFREADPDGFVGMLDNAAHRWADEFSPAAGRTRFLQILQEFGLVSITANERPTV